MSTVTTRPHQVLSSLRGASRPKGWQLGTLLVAFLASAATGYLVYQRVAAPVAVAPKGQVVTVRRGSLVASVSTTGQVVAVTTSKLPFLGTASVLGTGTVAKVFVQVGDSVKKGQPLAQLDTTDLNLKVTQSQANVAAAQAQLLAIQQGSRKEDIASAQAALDSANAKLTLLRGGPTAADVAAAQAGVNSAQTSLASAQAKLATLQAQPNPDDVKAAQSSLTKARQALDAEQVSRNGICGAGANTAACLQADTQLGAAFTAIDTAQANLQKVSLPATAADVQAAKEAIDSAQTAYNSAVANLKQVEAGTTDADLSAAKAAAQSAASNLALKQQPYTNADLKSAQAVVDGAKAGLAAAQNNLANATLYAPYDGIVAAVGMNPGEFMTSGATITLVDPKALRVNATADESDVAKIEIGQQTNMTFDALPGQQFSGKVIAISPSGTTQSGVVTFLISISLDDSSGLMAGMTANATIIYQQKEDVLLVPNRALRSQGRGRAVDVLVGGESQSRPVQVGLSNDQYTEVTQGLQEGDQVLVSSTTTTAPRVGGGPVRVGPGFGGPGGGG